MSVMFAVNLAFIFVVVLFGVAVFSPRGGTKRQSNSGNRNAKLRALLIFLLCLLAGVGTATAQETAQGNASRPTGVDLPAVPTTEKSAARAEAANSVLSNAEILQMVKTGFAEETILKAIQLSPTRFDTNVAALVELKSAGASEKVIRAMLHPKAALAEEKPATPPRNPLVPDDVGVYYIHNDQLEEMHPELLAWRSGGVAKSMFLGTKGHINGVLKGTQSKLQLGMPLEFVVRCTENVDITEFMLIKLDVKPDRREFRALTGGYIHASSGLDKNAVPYTFTKLAPRTYRIRLTDMSKGEYGFLPPGGQYGAIGGGTSGAMIMQGAASVGKIYSFRVIE